MVVDYFVLKDIPGYTSQFRGSRHRARMSPSPKGHSGQITFRHGCCKQESTSTAYPCVSRALPCFILVPLNRPFVYAVWMDIHLKSWNSLISLRKFEFMWNTWMYYVFSVTREITYHYSLKKNCKENYKYFVQCFQLFLFSYLDFKISNL